MSSCSNGSRQICGLHGPSSCSILNLLMAKRVYLEQDRIAIMMSGNEIVKAFQLSFQALTCNVKSESPHPTQMDNLLRVWGHGERRIF